MHKQHTIAFHLLTASHTWSYLIHLTSSFSFKHRDKIERKQSISYNFKEFIHATKLAMAPAKLFCKKVHQINYWPSCDKEKLFFPSQRQR